MKFPEKLYSLSLALIAIILLGLYFYNLFLLRETNNSFIIFGLSSALLSYRFSNGYKSKNSLENLIKKQGSNVEVSPLNPLPFKFKFRVKIIEINRISKITIGNNWLSIIIGNNGNGYDFPLLGTSSQIDEHVRSLIIPKGESEIDFQYLK